MCMLKTL